MPSLQEHGWGSPWGSIAAVLGLFVVPIGVGLVNPDSPFSPLYHDCWLYHGYFIDLPGHLRAFGDLYYSSRLSMTLPGWLIYKSLPPLAANLVLHLGVYLLGVLSLYIVLRQTLGARAGLLAALLMGGHFFYQTASASDYCDGYAIGYFLLAMAFSTKAAFSDRFRRWLFLAGLAGAALVVVNLMLGLLLLPLLLHHLMVNRAGRRHPLDAGGFWLMLGGASLLVTLACFSKFVGGPFWFLSASLRFAHSFQQQANPFKRPVFEWLPLASWLVWPTVATLGALLYLVSRHRRKHELATAYQVQLVGMLALLVGFELSDRHNLLQLWLYAGPFLIPLSFLALAGQWSAWLEALSARGFVTLASAAVLLPVLAAGLPARMGMVVPVFLLALLALVAVLLPTWRAGLLPGTLALGLLTISEIGLRQGFRMENALAADSVQRMRLHRAEEFTGQRRQVFECMHRTMRDIRRLDPGYQACFWFDIDEPAGLLFDNIACMHCWGQRLINTSFPDLNTTYVSLRPGMKLLVLSTSPTTLSTVRQVLGESGLEARELRRQIAGQGDLGFNIHLIETGTDPVAGSLPPRNGGS